jgi:hypothetical protein
MALSGGRLSALLTLCSRSPSYFDKLSMRVSEIKELTSS